MWFCAQWLVPQVGQNNKTARRKPHNCFGLGSQQLNYDFFKMTLQHQPAVYKCISLVQKRLIQEYEWINVSSYDMLEKQPLTVSQQVHLFIRLHKSVNKYLVPYRTHSMEDVAKKKYLSMTLSFQHLYQRNNNNN